MKDEKHPALCGEWSAALTDCAWWLNGVNRGSRYAGNYSNPDGAIGQCKYSNDVTKMNKTDKKNTRKLIEAQLDAYTNYGRGYFFWCYKTENAVEWDLTALVNASLFPQPLSDRKYASVLDDNFSQESAGGRVVAGNYPSFLFVVCQILVAAAVGGSLSEYLFD
ncbi:unnamed protein product [Ambrosiozyma monospora]|uniref:Unnamed protein product n=1 Tax=Ambrosiozyma monospora TaxID=43982 RepID=A0ACB5TWY3_AMBMO|nr:unnamed protein product [Ambrosiozyma monospora]